MENWEAPLDETLQRDLEHIVAAAPEKEALQGSSILITGATGLVGSLTVKALACMNRLLDTDIRIMAGVRNPRKARSLFGPLLDRGDLTLVPGDVTEPIPVDGPVDYLIHTASVTASKTFVTKPVETLVTAIEGTRNMLELAKEKRVRSMVYVSSMEAYGITDPALERVCEKDLGYIDVLNVRSSYSEGKRACECLCAAYASEYGVPVKIARLAQTFGAGVSAEDTRVFAQFARSCMTSADIVLHTAGNSMGNYCYTTDTILSLLTLLHRGRDGEAYTVANDSAAMRIRQVAQLASDTLTGGRVKIVFDIPESALTYGYAPDVTMRLSNEKLRQLGWEPEIPLPEMFRRLVKSFEAQAAAGQ